MIPIKPFKLGTDFIFATICHNIAIIKIWLAINLEQTYKLKARFIIPINIFFTYLRAYTYAIRTNHAKYPFNSYFLRCSAGN